MRTTHRAREKESARHRFCLKTSSAQHSGTHGANSLEFFPAGGVLGSTRGRVRDGDEEVRDTDGMQNVAAEKQIKKKNQLDCKTIIERRISLTQTCESLCLVILSEVKVSHVSCQGK